MSVPPPLPPPLMSAPPSLAYAGPLVASHAASRATSRTRAIGLGAIVVGAVGLLGAAWPFVFGGDAGIDAYVGTAMQGRWILWGRLALAGGFPLLAFYGLRLLVQAAPGAAADVRPHLLDNLGKIRFVLAGCIFLSIVSAAAAMNAPDANDPGVRTLLTRGRATPRTSSQSASSRGLPTFLLYAACGIACGLISGNVRKALAEFVGPDDVREETRGFEVSFGPQAEAGAPAPAAAAHAGPAATSSPAVFPPAFDPAHRDLRTLLNLAAAAGVIVGTIGLPSLLEALETVHALYGGTPALGGGRPRVRATSVGAATTLVYAALVARALVGLCGAFWIVWGVLCVTVRPVWRTVAVWVAGGMIAGTASHLILQLWMMADGPARLSGGTRTTAWEGLLRDHLLQAVIPVFLYVLLTRPGVRDVFTRGSEAAEA